MRNIILTSVLLFSLNALAEPAEILATDQNGQRVSIALDAKDTPRENGKAKTYPTIKSFRDEWDYVDFCYNGSLKSTTILLVALIEAADGDGDSYAELISIKSNAKAEIKVAAKIEDESGERKEEFTFKPCEVEAPLD